MTAAVTTPAARPKDPRRRMLRRLRYVAREWLDGPIAVALLYAEHAPDDVGLEAVSLGEVFERLCKLARKASKSMRGYDTDKLGAGVALTYAREMRELADAARLVAAEIERIADAALDAKHAAGQKGGAK